MKISILTATFNEINKIHYLVECLKNQTDTNFDWIVADGGSTDGTIQYLKNLNFSNLKIIEGPDFGIYDALNKAILSSDNDFYIVLGADDILYLNSIEVFRKEISIDNSFSFYIFPVSYNNIILKPKNKFPWYYGQFCFISTHSVGLLINKKMHDIYGLYSRRFPIAADHYFIMKVINSNQKIKYVNFVSGVHGSEGVSGSDHLGVMTEFYRVQINLGYNKYCQTFIFICRLIKNIFK